MGMLTDDQKIIASQFSELIALRQENRQLREAIAKVASDIDRKQNLIREAIASIDKMRGLLLGVLNDPALMSVAGWYGSIEAIREFAAEKPSAETLQ